MGVFWAPCSIPLIYLLILIATPHLVVIELWWCYEVKSSSYDFKIVLDILSLSHFQRTFRISLSIFQKKKKSLWDDDRDYVESIDQFGENCDIIEFSNPWTCHLSSFIQVFCNFFFECFIVFNVETLHVFC